MTALHRYPAVQKQLLYFILSTTGLLGANDEGGVICFQLTSAFISATNSITFGRLLLAVIFIYLQNEDEDDNVTGVLKINSTVLKALSDTQVKTWVYRKSKCNYYENVHYCLEEKGIEDRMMR